MISRKKILAICLTLVTLLTVTSFTTVSAATKIEIISGSSRHAVFWRQITTEVPAKVVPVTQSQALHSKGVTTSIRVDSSRTNSVTASTSLTTGADAIFAKFPASMSVSTTQSYTSGTSVGYTIDKKMATGRYRIEHVYPCVQVKQERVFSDSSGEKIEWGRTIKYAPKTNAAYRRLNRYAN